MFVFMFLFCYCDVFVQNYMYYSKLNATNNSNTELIILFSCYYILFFINIHLNTLYSIHSSFVSELCVLGMHLCWFGLDFG